MGSSSSMNPSDHKVIGAIATYTWNEYNQSGKDCVAETDNLQFLNIELQVIREAYSILIINYIFLCAEWASCDRTNRSKIPSLCAYDEVIDTSRIITCENGGNG